MACQGCIFAFRFYSQGCGLSEGAEAHGKMGGGERFESDLIYNWDIFRADLATEALVLLERARRVGTGGRVHVTLCDVMACD